MKILTVLAALLLFTTIGEAQPKSSPSTKLKLGYVEDAAFGCGCSLSRDKLDERNRRYVLISPMDEPAQIKLNGENVRLRLVAASKERRNPKVGDRSWETYSAGSLRVRIDYIVTGLCDPNEEACEVTYYKALLTVTRKKQQTLVKTIGLCGC